MRLLIAAMLLLMGLPAGSLAAPLYTVTKIDERVYAAIVNPTGPVASNAFIVVTSSYVVVAGAHFTADASAEITRIIAGITPLPLRYVILTHHHQGFDTIDSHFPPTIELIASSQTWAKLRTEQRLLRNQVVSFDKELTINGGNQKIQVKAMEAGHSTGDVIVYLPEQAVLFTSDLVYNNEAGFMADGSARGWVQDLQLLEHLVVTKVAPGRGEVTDSSGIRRFRVFLQELLTEALGHVERGESATETIRKLNLSPENTPRNFARYRSETIAWAWSEVQQRR